MLNQSLHTTGPARVIAVGNLKGGTGKSTVSVNMAAALAVLGWPTVVVDTDPQKTATEWARGRRLPTAVADFPLRDLNAAGEWLGELELLKRRYRRLVIDLPAVLSPALAAAFLVADMILIPTSTSQIDVQATRRTLSHVAQTRRERRLSPPTVMIVPTQVRKGLWTDGGVRRRLTQLGEAIAPSFRYDANFAKAFERQTWIGQFNPGCSGHRDALALTQVVDAVLRDSPAVAMPRLDRTRLALPAPQPG